MIFLAISIRFFFFIIMKVKLVRTICTQGDDAASAEDQLIRLDLASLAR
jgi:hypothetical protein